MTAVNITTTFPATTAAGSPVSGLIPVRPRGGAWRAFRAVLWRDIYVSAKDYWIFALQISLQPLFMLFIFAKVLGSLNYVTVDYGPLLLAGIVALTTFLTALQTVCFSLVMEFSFSKEIEDRLLAPLPTWTLAVEKLTIAIVRGVIAGIAIFPIGTLVLGGIRWQDADLLLVALMLPLGAWVGAAIGLTMGTLIRPDRANIIFTAVLAPMMFTGAVQYPWPSLDEIRWFQIVTAGNPLTYCAEAMRAALTPAVPHIATWVSLVVVGCAGTLFTAIGIKGFLRRAID